MFQRLWAAAAVLTTIAAPVLAQNPPVPPPQPAPSSADSAKARQLPRPQRAAPSNVTVTTGERSSTTGGVTLDSTLLAGFRWRNIGPANMGGRVSSVAGIPSPSKTFFVAAAAGGIWETTNGGTTIPAVFDHEECLSNGEPPIATAGTTDAVARHPGDESRY